MPDSPKPSADAPGAIVLVEGYDALVAAITAALRKFAPGYQTSVARSLAEAEAIAHETPPHLIIVDFDPPYAGALEAFTRLQKILPAARILIITSGAPHETLRARPQPCAFQFIEKPFELAEFGAALTTLVAGARRAPENASLGTLRDLNLLDVIPLQCLGGEISVITVQANGKRPGEIHFARGQIVHATTARSAGIDALEQMLAWPSPHFAFLPQQTDPPRSIRGAWPMVLLDLLRSMRLPEEANAPEAAGAGAAANTRPSKKIVVIDDTEMLRIFVEEILTTANPNLRIITAADAADGLREVTSTLPDLVLLDYSLPDFNGDEICRLLLEKPETARIPVIMMSGHVPEMTAAAARFRNIVATLPKPYLSAALIELVAQTLESSRELRASPEKPAPVAPRPPPLVKQLLTQSALVVARAQSSFRPERARIALARNNAVIVGIPLEVVTMQFSETLAMAAIRARPSSGTVSLQVDPSALALPALSGARFELERVDLDSRGQICALRLAATSHRSSNAPLPKAVRIDAVALLPAISDNRVQLTPAAAAPMKIELLAAFELAGVELSAGFSVACLVLQARARAMRVSFQPGAARPGATFEAAEVSLDRSSRILEILLNAVA